MKRIFLVFFLGMFLISFTSAFEFDNYYTYDESTRTASFKNGLTFGSRIAEIKLNTPLDMEVAEGYNYVFELELWGDVDYSDFVRGIYVHDKKKGYGLVNRGIDLKYLNGYETKQRDIFGCINEKVLANQTKACSEYGVVGTEEYQVEVWDDLLPRDLKQNDHLIVRGYTDVKVRDKMEWYIDFFGAGKNTGHGTKGVREWASWTQSLNVDITDYFKFDEQDTTGSGVIIDSIGNNNATNNGASNSSGKIFTAYDYDGTNDFISLPINSVPVGEQDRTLNLWVNSDDVTSFQSIIGYGAEVNGQLFHFRQQNTGALFFQNQGTSIVGNSSLSQDVWEMVTMTYQSSAATVRLYHNATLVAEGVMTLTTSTGSPLRFGVFVDGAQEPWDGGLDEAGIWNRTLSPAEITQLFNNGMGISFVNLSVTLNSPADNLITTDTLIEFNCSANLFSGTNIENISLYTNETGSFEERNVTTGLSAQEVTETWNRTFSDVSMIWSCRACDEGGSCFFADENRTLVIDATVPSINISIPVGNQGSNFVGGTQNLNWTVSDPNIDSCFFNYNGTNVSVNCLDNSTTFIIEADNLNLTFFVNDTAGNENSQFTSWFYSFLESSATFNSSAFETSTQSFILNLTTLPSILSVEAILNYNNTRFTTQSECVSNVCTISTSIDLPLITSAAESENRSFFWEITGFNATSSFDVNSSVRVQNVTRIHLEECGGAFTNETLNFTAFDEQTLQGVDPFSFNADFEFWLGTGTVIRTNNFSNSSLSSIQLCILPDDVVYNINGVVEYDEASGTNYTTRNYYFQDDQISATVQDIGLGLLLADQSTSFILKVQNSDILPLPDALIFTERFYPGLGEFLIVQVAKTDDNGKSVGFFEAETGDYRFIIKQGGVTLLTTPAGNRSQKVVGEEVPFTLTFTVGEDEGPSWEDFEPVDELISNLTYNTQTQIVTFPYSDTSATFSLALLQVFDVNATGDDALICTTNLSQAAGILMCNMTGNSTGNYIAKGIIFRGETRILAQQIIFTIEDFTTEIGRLGLFLGWFVILISALAFKFNEIAGIILINITMIFVNVIGLLNFGVTWITAWVALSILILVVLER